jgi:hypothetical protein
MQDMLHLIALLNELLCYWINMCIRLLSTYICIAQQSVYHLSAILNIVKAYQGFK